VSDPISRECGECGKPYTDEMEDENEQLRTERTTMAALHEAELHRLRVELSSAFVEVERLKGDLATTTNANANLQRELTGLKADTAAHYWNAVRDDNTALRADLAASREQTAAWKREAETHDVDFRAQRARAEAAERERDEAKRDNALLLKDYANECDRAAAAERELQFERDLSQQRMKDAVAAECEVTKLREALGRAADSDSHAEAVNWARVALLDSPTTPAGDVTCTCYQTTRGYRQYEPSCPEHGRAVPIETPGNHHLLRMGERCRTCGITPSPDGAVPGRCEPIEAPGKVCVCGEPSVPGQHRTDGPCLAPATLTSEGKP
jgi:hypothetical protein